MNDSRASPPTAGTLVRTGFADHVLTITLSRPEKRNALNSALVDALHATIAAAAKSDDVRAIVIEGAGPGFCAGADLAEFKGVTGEPGLLMQERSERIAAMFETIASMKTPVVAAVHGATVGAGVSLALVCDLVVMAQSAQFSYPEVRHGTIGSVVLADLVGHVGLKSAFEFLAFGEPIASADALRLGMVNRVVADTELGAEALRYARRLAEFDRHAIGSTKVLLRQADGMTWPEALHNGLAFSRKARGL
jgi:enoyl-CoA hydratase/carnithine racemase